MKNSELEDIIAFKLLYEKYSSRVYGFLFSSTGSVPDSKDLLQNTFLKVWENRRTLDYSKNVESYIFTISRNLLYNHFRAKTYQRLSDIEIDSLQLSLSEEFILEGKEMWDRYAKVLKEIPQRRREIFLLSRVENLSYKEIAEKMGISENTVDTQIRRALNFIRSKGVIILLLFFNS